MQLDREARQLLDLLEQAGYRAYAVGGCVRDACMGRACADIDLCTSALPRQTEAVLAAAGIRYIETGLQHGTVSAVLNGKTYEDHHLSYRRQLYGQPPPGRGDLCAGGGDGSGAPGFYRQRHGLPPGERIGRSLSGGQADMKAKCLRCVGEPRLRFTEDALRILRALRFAAVLGFTLEKETAKAAFELKERLHLVSAERIYVELKKLLLGDWAFDVLVESKEIIGVVVPESYPPSIAPSKIHGMFTMCLPTLPGLWRRRLRTQTCGWSCSFHDTGKPACKTTDEEGIDHFYGHPTVSEQLAKAALERLKASRASMQRILPLIRYHDGHILTDEKSIKRWLNRLGQAGTLDLIDVKTADLAAQNLARTQPEIEELYRTKALLRQILERGDAFALRDLAIGGEELLALRVPWQGHRRGAGCAAFRGNCRRSRE